MQTTAQKGVSPILATLLLIAIAVAAGIIVYVYVNSLSGGLTGGGGGQQVSDQLSLDSCSFSGNGTSTATFLVLHLRDTGAGSVSISSVYYDGNTIPLTSCISPCVWYAQSPANPVSVGSTVTLTLTVNGTLLSGSTPPLPSAGTSHIVKVITTTGGQGIYSVTAGRSG